MSDKPTGVQDAGRQGLPRAGTKARKTGPGTSRSARQAARRRRVAGGLGRSGAQAAAAGAVAQGSGAAAPKTPFILLVLGLLGGGLVCLLVINTTLGAASFKISQLQQSGTTLAQQEQSLQQEVSAQEAPAQIEQRAYRLGMRPQSGMHFLDLASPAASPGRAKVSERRGKRRAADRKELRR